MRATKKQFLSLLLALAMLVSFTPPVSIRATEDDEAGYSLPMPDNGTLEVTEVTEDVSEIIVTDSAEEVPSDIDDPSTFIDLETDESATADFPETESESASEISPAPPSGVEAATGNSATVRAAPSSVNIPQGSSARVTLTHSGYNGSVYYRYSPSNSNLFSVTWGGWDSYYSYSFQVTGRQAGRGTIHMYLYSSTSNARVGRVDISVTVTDNAPPTLTLQPSRLNLRAGESGSFQVSYRNCPDAKRLQYQLSNETVVRCQWTRTASGAYQLNVRALRSGEVTVTAYVCDSYGRALAQAYASVTVVPDVSLSVSPSSVTVQSGRSVSVRVTVQGSGSYRLASASSNPTAFGGSFSGGSAQGSTVTKTLVITGRNAGNGFLTVHLKTPGGEILQSARVQVSVIPAVPTLTVSPTSVTTPAQVRCTLTGASGEERLCYSVSDSSLMGCSWSAWQNNVIYLNIAGRRSGTGTVRIYIEYGGERHFASSVSVRTSGAEARSIGDYSYPFANYDKPDINLSVCQYIFGNNQYAQQAYNWHLGNGGVCFGIVTSSGLFSAGSPRVNSFSGKTSISNLLLYNYSAELQLYLYEFIEAMHLSQKAQSMSLYSGNSSTGLQNLIQALNQGPVVVCILPRNSGNGHAVLAYDYVDSALKVYDPNTPLREKSLTISGGSWSYLSSSGYRWSSAACDIYYIPYSTYSSVWRNRGSLMPRTGANARNLLITSATDFSLYAAEGNEFAEEPIVRYQGGVAQVMGEDVQEVFRAGALPGMEDADALQPIALYLPVGYYKMVGDGQSDTLMDVSLSHENVAVRVTTDADECYLRADDETENAFSTLPGIEDGRRYEVSLYSMEDGQSKEITVRGENRSNLETTVSLDADSGSAAISSKAFGDSGLSVAEAATADVGDISLSIAQETESQNLFITWTDGGRVVKETTASGETMCRIRPDEGYITKDVLVSQALETNLASQGPVTEYLFQQTGGVLHAEFARKAADAWDVRLSGETDGAGLPQVTVTYRDDAEGLPALEEGADYVVSYEDLPGAEDALYVTATPESGFLGVVEVPCQLPPDDASEAAYEIDAARTAYWRDGAEVRVRVVSRHAGPAVIAVAAYAENTQLIALGLDSLSAGETEKTLSLPFNQPDAFTVKAFLLDDAGSMKPLYQFTVPPAES
ncbi:MAG: hypothetical protein IJR48_08030 [Oscillibacter sp.]|nr:hypothetical protein [Oscillibacter sp.]